MTLRATAPRLAVVPDARDTLLPRVPPARRGAAGDLALLAFLFGVSVVPIVGLATGGRWGERMVGLATVIALLVGRELVRELRAWARAR